MVEMAEVGHRLLSGAYRFTAVRNSHALPACSGDSHGSSDLRVREETTPERRESLLVTCRRAKQNKPTTLWRDKTQSEHWLAGLCCVVHESAGQQLLLHQQLLARRKTLWSRRTVSIIHDTFRYPHQDRLFSTVIFLLTNQGSNILRRHRASFAPCRSYSGKNNDAGLLYRSRTSYYDILRVSPGATQSQIKTAYYKQSFIYHPDKNPGNKAAVQRFSEVSEAYAVLGNVTLRRKYDRGILGPSDLQSPGRPFTKESTVGSPGFKQQHRAQQFSQTRGKVHFDFDAFYQAHYGEQLQREKSLRARRKQMQEHQDKARLSWKKDKMMEIVAALLLTMAGLLFVSVSKPWSRLKGKVWSCWLNCRTFIMIIWSQKLIEQFKLFPLKITNRLITLNTVKHSTFSTVSVTSASSNNFQKSPLWSTCVKTLKVTILICDLAAWSPKQCTAYPLF